MSSSSEPLHPRHALAAGLLGALLGLLASTLSGCEVPLACDPRSSTTCPPDQVCDVGARICVDAFTPGDGDGDGDGPCTDGCAPARLVESFEGAATLLYDRGDLYVGGRTPGTSRATLARVDPTTGATTAIAADLTEVSRIVAGSNYVYWVDDTSYTGFDEIWRSPRAGGPPEMIFVGDGFEEVTGDAGSMAFGGGYVFWGDGFGEIYRADQAGTVEITNLPGNASGLCAGERYLFVTTASSSTRLAIDGPFEDDAAITLAGPRDGRQAVIGAVYESAPGEGFVYWGTRAEDGSQGNLVRMDFEGGTWELLVEGVDPQGGDEDAEIIALVPTADVVYYATDDSPSEGGGAVYRLPIGGTPERLRTGDIGGLAVGGGAYFVSDRASGTVERLPLP